MSRVEAIGLVKRWGEVVAVDDVSFVAEANSFVVLLGPSGCGKSTILRMIAGLETPTEGRILIDGKDVAGVDAAKRGISMVFQSYALFPHLSVADNIVFGLKVRHVAKAEREERLARVAALVGLADLLERKPAQLSGGQRQRVAVARAVVAEHSVCLMDEPLSNLDAKLRNEMRAELRDLQRRLGMTVLYVTHDQTEAMSMADQVVLLDAGRLVQAGPPEVLYQRPATSFAARFIGAPPMNLLPLLAVEGGGALAGDPTHRPVIGETPAAGSLLGVRPEDLQLRADGSGLPVVVTSTDYHGADTVVGVRLAGAVSAAVPANAEGETTGDEEILVRVPGRVHLAATEAMRLSWQADALHLFGPDGTRQDPRPRALSLTA